MKKVKHLLCLLVCICALVALFSVSASAATKEIRSLSIVVDDPVLGKALPTADDVWFNNSKYLEIAEFEWYGDVGAGNTAITDEAYAFKLVLKIAEGADAVFGLVEPEDLLVNEKKIMNTLHYWTSDDKTTITIYYRFAFTLLSSGKHQSLTRYTGSTLTVEPPTVNRKPQTAADIAKGQSKIDIVNAVWDGALDANGCFKYGVKYTLTVDIRLKDSVNGMFNIMLGGGTINGNSVHTSQAYLDDYRSLRVSYTFSTVRDPARVTEKNNTRMEITAPKIGEWPTYTPVIPADWNTYVSNCEWSGTFDKYGRFQAGKSYTLTVTVRVKPTSTSYKLKDKTDNLINGDYATIKSVSSDGKEMKLSYTFPALTGSAAPAPTGTVVDAFENGDYGMLKITKGTITYLKDLNDINSFYDYNESTDRVAGTRTEINIVVLEANVKADNGRVYHAVLKDGKIAYIASKGGAATTYGELLRFGNRALGSYHNLWSADKTFTQGMIEYITTTDPLVLENGVPKLEIHSNTSADTGASGYYLASVEYSTDKAQPYTFVTATATYKAKPGRFFYEKVFYDNPPTACLLKGCSAEIKYIDRETVQILYTIWAADIYNQDSYTHDMEVFARAHQSFDEVGYVSGRCISGGTQKLYAATAEYYNPLGTWFESMNLPASLYNTYKDKFFPKLLDVPSDNGYGVESIPATGTKVTLYDADVSDMFPGQMVGEWAMVTAGGHFVPKAMLRNIDTSANNTQGTAGHHVDPICSFAGGTGTAEDPYLIATAEQLNAIRLNSFANPKVGLLDYSDTHYKLIADIDLSGWGNWVPIGGTRAYGGWPQNSGYAHYGSFTFAGTFDGNGHTISGMTIKIDEDTLYPHNSYVEVYLGLFAATSGFTDIVGTNGTQLLYQHHGIIKNLTVKDFTIDVTLRNLTATTEIHAGGLAGLSTSTRITNCKSVGGKINIQLQTDTTKDPDINVDAAGLVGLSRDAQFTNCSSTSTVNVVTNSGVEYFDNVRVDPLVVKTEGNDSTKLTNSKGTGKVTEKKGELAAQKSSFSDVLTTKYYYKPVEWMVSQTITNGTTPTTFDPNATCNRGQILTMLWRAAGRPAPTIANPYTDVPAGKSITEAAIWAYEKGIITSTTFDRYAPCTRGDSVIYIWKACGSPSASKTATFSDVPAGSELAKAVSWAVEKKMVDGYADGTFNPGGICTRAHIAKFLYYAMGVPQSEKLN